MPELDTRRIIDAHVHLWDTDRFPLSWWKPSLGLPRRCTLDDYRAVSNARSAVTVQAGEGAAEADWLVAAARTSARPTVAVVAQTTPEPGRPIVVPEAMLASEMAGLRLSLRGHDRSWASPESLDGLANALASAGIVLELLIRPDQLSSIPEVASRHPELTIVICHLALGSARMDDEWRRGMTGLARFPSVAAKASGAFASDRDRAEAVRIAVDSFGPNRLMFGSDWPISTRSIGWSGVVARTTEAIGGTMTAGELDAFWFGTAAQIYGRMIA